MFLIEHFRCCATKNRIKCSYLDFFPISERSFLFRQQQIEYVFIYDSHRSHTLIYTVYEIIKHWVSCVCQRFDTLNFYGFPISIDFGAHLFTEFLLGKRTSISQLLETRFYFNRINCQFVFFFCSRDFFPIIFMITSRAASVLWWCGEWREQRQRRTHIRTAFGLRWQWNVF